MDEPLLDLVAVAYQAPSETGNFLGSLSHIDVPFTITVIDNNSPDPAVRRTIEAALPVVNEQSNCRAARAVFNAENVGYARAVNQGMLGSRSPYAAILNCDVEFLPSESMRTIVKHFEANPDVGVIGPRTHDSQGKLTHAGIITTPDHPRNHHRGWQQRDVGQYRDTMEVNTVSGATYFVRTSMWHGLAECPDYLMAAPDADGAFLPTPHFFEETYCSYHARHHGWKVVYLGNVAMIHQWHRSSQVGSKAFKEPQEMFFNACRLHGIDITGEKP
jgi:GT2 family glycosyltransferase